MTRGRSGERSLSSAVFVLRRWALRGAGAAVIQSRRAPIWLPFLTGRTCQV
ncbi:hypothetical protein [Streptomyces phaeoluteigriseus]|uniref:hypothetical protein n=1 Tax=Streptomyces phaeoluteigriseus TaxID=114686 RepID=UPI001301C69D|nr:hypothetical protein [Streptomyces phaeoluteigriseus]